MQKFSFPKLAAGLCALGMVAACAPEPAPAPLLSPQPSYNKMGELQDCGYGYVVRGQECIRDRPEDECDETYSTSRNPDCIPPWRDDDDDPQRDPTGAPRQ